MTHPVPAPGTRVQIRPGAASAFGREFPDGGRATVFEEPMLREFVGRYVYVLPDGDPEHHRLRLRVEDVTPIDLAEEGRRLASEREDLIAAGVDPKELLVPLHPDMNSGVEFTDDEWAAFRGAADAPPVDLTPAIEQATRAFYAEAGVPFAALSPYDREHARRGHRAALTAVVDALTVDNPFANHYPAPRDAGDVRYGSGTDGCSCGDKLMGGRAAHLMSVLRTAVLGAGT